MQFKHREKAVFVFEKDAISTMNKLPLKEQRGHMHGLNTILLSLRPSLSDSHDGIRVRVGEIEG